MQQKTQQPFWQWDAEYWYKELESSADGLTRAAAQLRAAAKHGKRVTPRWQKNLKLFLGEFNNPLMLLLISAVILSGFLGDWPDVYIILFIVLSTGILSYLQERNAGKVVEKLQSLLSLKSIVVRDGSRIETDATTVVPGDVILLSAGDIVPADCLVTEANELHANEAALTGESYPVRKIPGVLDKGTELAKRTNCLWEGSNIVSGTGRALVIATGTDTIFGRIAQSAAAVTQTAFEKGIRDFGYLLMRITLVLSAVILAINLLNHKTVIDSALFALALAVGMAPELLPAITTIAMSAGARRLLDKKVIVKKLPSIQNLGETTLLCTDKTGTITEGVITVAGIKDSTGNDNERVRQLACWNALLESGYANPIDNALRKLAADTAPPQKTGEIPYDFIRKRISIALDTGTEKLLVSKGSYAEIMACCNTVLQPDGIMATGQCKDDLDLQYEKYGQQGLRAIAVSYKPLVSGAITREDEHDMVFAGFVLLEDPVKDDIKDALAQLRALSVELKVITGDNRNVAMAICEQLGITSPIILTGAELDNMTSDALAVRAQSVHIFAEMEPQQKEQIVRALRNHYAVAYMGDGINDVQALNAADVGISVNNAVDIAKEAADFVLLEKELSVLADGIREGRKTFANTMKYIFINTGSTFGNMFSVATASLILPFLPMLPKQILLTNFITDFPYLAIASDNVDGEQLAVPGKWNLRFITRYMIVFGIHSSLFDVITFVTLYYWLKVKETAFQTGWFIESILTELFILFIVRTYKNFFKSRPGKYLLMLSAAGLALTVALPYLPFAATVGLTALPLQQMGLIFAIVLAYLLTADMLKVWFFRTRAAQ